jgi:exopolysaccharide biosynthesis WecB/TagA/CpsF family protein
MTVLRATDGRDRAASADVVSIFGIPFRDLSRDEAIAHLRALVQDGGRHHVVLANAHTLNAAASDPAYRAIVANASLVLRDGVGVELASLVAGRRLATNFVGTDFVPAVLDALQDVVPRVALFGAAPGVATAAAACWGARFPRLPVTAVEHGYGDGERAAERLRRAAPALLLVALGNPLQERWIARHLPTFEPCVAMGVGALFDYVAGRTPRAPRWMRDLRSEWIFRLVVEPRRLARRYLVGNPMFLWRVAAHARDATRSRV